jgi:hypothetical protein
MHLKLWDLKPSRGFNKTRDIDMDIDMWHDMARKRWHGGVIQQRNKVSELILIDLQTRRKGREMEHMPATRATHLLRLSSVCKGCSGRSGRLHVGRLLALILPFSLRLFRGMTT